MLERQAGLSKRGLNDMVSMPWADNFQQEPKSSSNVYQKCTRSLSRNKGFPRSGKENKTKKNKAF